MNGRRRSVKESLLPSLASDCSEQAGEMAASAGKFVLDRVFVIGGYYVRFCFQWITGPSGLDREQ